MKLKPKKKFKVRIKQSSSRRASRPEGMATSTKATIKKSVKVRLHEAARTTEVPELAPSYDAICGFGRPLDDSVASNLYLLGMIHPLVLSDFEGYLRDNPSPVGHQVTRIAVTPGSNAVVSIPEVRKAVAFHRRAKVDAISTVRLRPVPYDDDPNGFGFAIELDTLIFGDDAEAKLSGKQRGSRRAPGPLRSTLQWVDPHDTETLRPIVKKLFLPNYTGVPFEDPFASPAVPPNWSKNAERNLRAYVAMMARAQLPLKYAMVLDGAGGTILARAIAEARRVLKEACKGAPPVIHPDGLPHFFFGELRRLGLDEISVPLVKLH